MNRVTLAVLVVGLLGVSSVPSGAHHPDEQVDEQLIEAGNRLMFGGFNAAQPGPLVVVPHRAGPLDCALAADEGYLLDAGPAAAVSFVTNGTHLLAVFDPPVQTAYYAAVAVDSGDAVRTLIMMQEHLVSMHRFGAAVHTWQGDAGNRSVRWGTMGVPYAVPGETVHDVEHDMPGEGIQLDHDDVPRGAEFCADEDPDHLAFLFEHRGPGKPLEPGVVVHAVTLFDDQVATWLPRPVDGSTSIRQFNLYLAREGEDPETVRAALSPDPGVDDWVPLVLLVAGAGWLWFSSRRRGSG